MAWRSSPWARWLGWTVVFALVAGACGLAYEVSIGCESWPRGLPLVADACGLAYHALGPGILPAWSLAYLVPPLVAAFVIGVRFPFWRWAAGPPVALFLVGTPLLLIPYEVAAPHIPESLFQSLAYAEAMTFALLFSLLSITIFLILLALVAAAGVRWGLRREAAIVSSTASNLGGDASTKWSG